MSSNCYSYNAGMPAFNKDEIINEIVRKKSFSLQDILSESGITDLRWCRPPNLIPISSVSFCLRYPIRLSKIPAYRYDGVSSSSLPLVGRVREGGVKQVIPLHTPLLAAG